MVTQKPKHYQEWLDSGVDPRLIEANITSIEGEEVFYAMYPNPVHLNNRTPDARTRKAIEFYSKLSGWYICGLDPLNNWEPRSSDGNYGWGRFKPETPVISPGWNKPAKYLSQVGKGEQSERAIYLDVPRSMWEEIALKWDTPIEESDKNFWAWVDRTNLAVIITEGEKKAGCLISHGFPAISVPGIASGYRKNGNSIRLITDLTWLARDDRTVIVLFDYREGINPLFSDETFKARRLGQCFRTKTTVKIALLPGEEKGVDDWIVAGGNIDELVASAKPLAWIDRQIAWAIKKDPDLKLTQRYLEIDTEAIDSDLAIRSPRGTGKTQHLVSLIEDAQTNGDRALLMTHRVVLGQSIAHRVGLPWVGQSDDYEYGNLFGFGLCVDSLHANSQARIEGEHWHGSIVIIDEVEQVLGHLLHSSTLTKQRTAVLATLGEIVRNAKRVIIQDADLSDMSIKFFEAMRGRQFYVIRNDYQVPQWDVTFFDTSKRDGGKDDPSGLVGEVADSIGAGEKAIIVTDSQKEESRWGTINLEKFFRDRFEGLRILRIDSETIADPSHPAYKCAGHINEVLVDYDLVLISPALSTGVSIDLVGHFQLVAGIFQGVGSANDVMQSLSRLREPVRRLVWAKRSGVFRHYGGDTSGWKILDSLEKRNTANRMYARLRDDALKVSASLVGALECWADLAARHNLDSWQFRSAVLESLRDEGHRVIISDQSDSIITDQAGEIRVESTVAEAIAVMDAEEISESQYLKLKEKKEKTPTERREERRYALTNEYGQGVTPPLYILDRTDWRQSIKVHYYLTEGREFLLDRDRRVADRAESSEAFLPDIRLYSAKVEFLSRMGVIELLEGEYRADSPEIESIANRCQTAPIWVKAIANFNPTNLTPIQIAGMLLSAIGFEWKGRQHRVDGERVRSYTAIPKGYPILEACGLDRREPEGLRADIFQHWHDRDAETARAEADAETARAEAESAIDPDWVEVRESIVTGLVDSPDGIEAYRSIVPVDQWDLIVKSLPVAIRLGSIGKYLI